MDYTSEIKIFLEDLDAYGYEYKHKNGLTLVFIEDKKCNNEVYVNITYHTPAIDNKGTAHVIEHCIASQSYSEGFFKQFASTYQDKTSYEYVLDSSNLNAIPVILKNIFLPEFKENKNIFLREAWRVEEKNGRPSIRGVVFNEIRDAFTSPFYSIINYIPFTLYHNSSYGNLSGGFLENILELTYDAAVDYHGKYYKANNCCIFIYSNYSPEIILELLLPVVSGLPLSDESINREGYSYDKIDALDIKYPSIVEDLDGYNFTSINYAVGKPQNQFEYNVYQQICQNLLCCENNDFIKNIKRQLIGKQTKAIFKNSLYKPYFSIILAYCKNNINEVLFKLTTQSLDSIIRNIDINKVPNFVLYSITKDGCNLDAFKLGVYIMEAFFSNLSPFSYVIKSTAAERKYKFIERIQNDLIGSPYYTIITLKPCKQSQKTTDKTLLEKAVKNRIINEYSTSEGIKSHETNRFTEKFILAKSYKELLPDRPILEIDDGVKFIYYKRKDSKINVHLYFDISRLSYEELCLIKILSIYFNYRVKAVGYSTFISTGCTIIFDEKNNSSFLRFVVRVSADKKSLEHILIGLEEIFISKLSYKDLGALTNELSDFKTSIDINLLTDIRSFILNRLLSYFSLCGFHKDSLMGIGFYEYLVRIMTDQDLLISKLSDIQKSFLTLDNLIVSIYAESKPFVFKNIKDLLRSIKKATCKKHIAARANKKNEGFITSSQTNCILMGFNYSELNLKYFLKHKILCNIITHNYLVPVSRNKYNAYACELTIIDNNMVFFSMKDPNLLRTLEVIKNTKKYIECNIDQILREFEFYKYNYIQKVVESDLLPDNDYATIKFLHPNMFKGKAEILSDLKNQISKEEILEFRDIIEKITEQNCYCVFGNEDIINENSDLFTCINYLPIYI